MSWIKCGTRVAFRDRTENITPEKPYTVWHDHRGRPYFYDDDGEVKMTRVASPECLRNFGGLVVSEPRADQPKDTRTALIEALKARFESLKDAPPTDDDAGDERRWAALALQYLYKIEAEIVPGPVTVRFTELANNH